MGAELLCGRQANGKGWTMREWCLYPELPSRESGKCAQRRLQRPGRGGGTGHGKGRNQGKKLMESLNEGAGRCP